MPFCSLWGRLHFQRTLLPEGGLCSIRCSSHSGNLPLTFAGCFNIDYGVLEGVGQEMPIAWGCFCLREGKQAWHRPQLASQPNAMQIQQPPEPQLLLFSPFCLGDKMRFKEALCHLWNHLVGKWQSTGCYSDSSTGSSSRTGPLSASYTNWGGYNGPFHRRLALCGKLRPKNQTRRGSGTPLLSTQCILLA